MSSTHNAVVLNLACVAMVSACTAEQDTTQGRGIRAPAPLPFGSAGAAAPELLEAAGAPAVQVAPDDVGTLPAQPQPQPQAQALGAHESRTSIGSTPLPCELSRVLATSCQGCHAAEPGAGAPMALVTREDLLAPAPSDPSRTVYELMAERVHDPHAPMPPASSRALTEPELAVMDAALAGAASLEGEACAGAGQLEPERPAPAADDVGECFQVRAHENAVAGDTEPYLAPSGEYYSCFYLEVPWVQDAQAVTVRALDTPLTHHLLLYSVTEAHAPGQIVREAPNCGIAFREVLAVWGQGQQREQNLPEGVGLALPSRESGRALMLEAHYFNDGEATADDMGFEICTARMPRAQTATITTTGVSLSTLPPGQATTLESSCSPASNEDIHIYRVFPHMHSRGVAFQSRIARADGTQDVVLDIGYDYNNQLAHEVDAVMRPGDRLVTRCQYVNDTDHAINIGYASEEEMCAAFFYAWPAGALVSGFLPTAETACVF